MRFAPLRLGPLRLVLALLVALTATLAAAQSRFEAAAVVNDQIVTRYDVEQRARLLVLNGAQAGAADLPRRALEQLIDDRLRLGAAERAGVRPSAAAVAEAVDGYAQQRRIAPGELDRTLGRAGVDRAALEEGVRAEIAWRDLIRRRFGPRAEPTDAEIDQEIALAAAGKARAFRVAEIVLPFSARGEGETRALADQLAAELGRGGDFAAAARRASAAPSAVQGGEVGWTTETALSGPVVEALSALSPGGVTQPLPVPGGLAILKLLETRTETVSARVTVEVLLAQTTGRDARARVAAFLAERPTCDTAPELAAARGLQTQRSAPTDLSALQPQVREAIAGLKAGEASAPVIAGPAAAAFLVCSWTEGDNAAARDELRRQIRSQRLIGFASGYLSELRGEAVVDYR